MLELLDISCFSLFVIIIIAFLAGVLHGATGMAGGIVMAAVLSNIIGVKAAIPVMTCALIFSHSNRVLAHLGDIDWHVCKRVLLFGVPTIILGAIVFAYLSPRTVAMVMATFLISSFPIKRFAKKHKIRTGPKLLAVASSAWGMLAGNVIGPGFFLAPFLLGTGMNRLTFVGSLATITLVMNVIKLSVFGATELLDMSLLALGVVVGLVSIPGNWFGRKLLRKMSDQNHAHIIDILTVLLIFNFLYLSIT